MAAARARPDHGGAWQRKAALLTIVAAVCAVLVYRLCTAQPQRRATPLAGWAAPSAEADVPGAPQCPTAWAPSNASIAFLHIPKTAGTFIRRLLKTEMPADGPGRWCRWGSCCGRPGVDITEQAYQDCPDGSLPPGQAAFLAEFGAAWRSGRCSGFNTHHDAGTLDALGVDPSRTLTVTMLRHPVERIISHYYYILGKHPGQLPEPANATDYSGLLSYSAGHFNRAVEQLASVRLAKICPWPHVADAADLTEEEVLQRAKRRLDSFCVVMIQELMEESLARLRVATGWALDAGDLPLSRNTTGRFDANNVNREKAHDVPLAVRQAIERHNRLDMQLYAYALQRFLTPA